MKVRLFEIISINTANHFQAIKKYQRRENLA
jgi:hypothetical protein